VGKVDTKGTDDTVASSPPNERTAVGHHVEVALAQTVGADPARPTAAPVEALAVVPVTAYDRLDEYARGGLGRIVRARDTRTGRIVAIKEMLGGTRDAAARFVREALVTANLQHPAIVPVYEVGRWTDGEPFYAMKLVYGKPLSHVIEATESGDERLALIPHVIAIADALAYAHGQRVIHRDLKPSNVLCGAFGETVVIDWGLARRLDDTDDSLPRIGSSAPGETVVGSVMGTPGYMAPEQARGERVDERADVYSIGAVLYYALTGRAPYAGKTVDEIIEKVRSEQPKPLTAIAPWVPPDLAAIVDRAMARDRAARYESAAELASDLRRFTTGQLVSAHHYTRLQRLRRFVQRHRAPVAVGTAAVIALASVGVVSVRRIVEQREIAEEQRAAADVARDDARRERDRAHASLVAALSDRARTELDAGHADRALPNLAQAVELGSDDTMTRFVAARTLAALPASAHLVDDTVASADVIPNSRDVVISTATNVVRWSPDTGRVAWRSPGIGGDVLALDATTLAAPAAEAVALISADDGKPIATLALHGSQPVGVLGVDPARRWLVAAVKDNRVDWWDVATRERIATSPVATSKSPIVAPDGQAMVVQFDRNTMDSDLAIVDRAGAVIAPLCKRCTVYRPFGNDIAFVESVRHGDRAHVHVVDWKGKPIFDLVPQSSANVLDVETDSAGHFAIAAEDGSVELYDIATRALRWRTQISDRAYQLHFDRAGRLWTLGTLAGVAVHHVTSGVLLAHWQIGEGAWMGVAGDASTATVVAIGKGVIGWAPAIRTLAIAPSDARVRRVELTDDGRVFAAGEDGVITESDARGTITDRIDADRGKRVVSLQLLPDHALLSSGRNGDTVIWDRASGHELERYPHSGPRAEASPDGQRIVTGNSAGEIVMWMRPRAEPHPLGKLVGDTFAVHWSRDGAVVAAIDEYGNASVWSRDGAPLRTIAGIREPLSAKATDFALSPDGAWLVRTGDYPEQSLFAVRAGPDRPLRDSKGMGLAFATAFSPDGTRVTLVAGGAIHTWTIDGGGHRVVAADAEILAARYSPDGALLFTAGLDRRVRAWDTATGAHIVVATMPQDIYGLSSTPDGGHIAIATLGPAAVVDVRSLAGDLAPQLARPVQCGTDWVATPGGLARRRVDGTACAMP
jgi:WD40 repeat protein/tRNA A-37 threonylcarbamoyl transferase component Bud32